MLVQIFDDMDLCSEEEVRRLLPLVSEQRRERALKFRHVFGQFACLKTYEMLCQMLGKDCLLFDYTTHGKPFLPDVQGIHFNISHCKNALAVAVDTRPVGIDVEVFRDAEEALLRYTMNPEEAERIRCSGQASQLFAEFWTRKESVLKLRGSGLVNDLHSVLSGQEVVKTFSRPEKRYAISIASSGEFDYSL